MHSHVRFRSVLIDFFKFALCCLFSAKKSNVEAIYHIFTFIYLWKITFYILTPITFFRSSFSDFVQKHGKDVRYRNIEKNRERESLFDEFIMEIRKREREEKNSKSEQVISMHLKFVKK